MKILSLHIENFGNLKNTDMDFSGELNTFLAENGEGKSTRTDFIYAILYGMKTVKASTKDFLPRTHYYPYDGGRYGGSITLEIKGKKYRIERFFDQKTDTKDTCTVTDSLGCDLHIDNPGEYFLALDGESFLRTACFRASDLEIGISEGIGERLSGLSDATEGKRDCQSAETILSDMAKNLKGRANSGIIPTLKNQLAEKKAEIYDLEAIERGFSERYKTRDEMKKALSAKEDELDKARKEELLFEKTRNYRNCLSEIENLTKQIDSVKQKYPHGIPEKDEINEVQNMVNAVSDEKIKRDAYANTEGDELERLKEIFRESVPEKEETDKIKDLCDVYSEASKVKAPEKSKEISDCENKAEKAEKKKGHLVSYLLYTAAALVFVGGCVLLFLNYITVSIALLFFGLLVLGIGAFLHLKKQTSQTSYDRERYNLLLLEYNDNYSKYRNACEQKSEAEKVLKEFFAKYKIENEDFLDAYYRLISAKDRYISLLEKEKKVRETLEKSNEMINEKTGKILQFLSAYGYDENSDVKSVIEKILEDKRTISDFKDKLEKEEEKSESIKPEYDVFSINNVDTVSLSNQIGDMKSELAAFLNQLNTDEEKTSQLVDERDEYDIKLRELDNANAKYDLITKTQKYLNEAKKNQSEKILAPMKNAFLFYAEKLSKKLTDRMAMDENITPTFERGGSERPYLHLSRGERALLALCMRLSLIDAVSTEKPTLIIDDAFSELDEEHLAVMKKLINELSKNTQIIYFTCHKSRVF